MNKNFFRNRYLVVCLVSLVSMAVIGLADVSRPLSFLNLKTYDLLFCIRSKTWHSENKAPIVMVDVDDDTLSRKEFQTPMALWHGYFGDVIEGLSDGGAQAIGLDYMLPSALFDDSIKGYSRSWRKAIVYSRNKETPVVAGFIQNKKRRIIPHKKYVFAIGSENIGFFNITPDQDDVVRRQRLIVHTKDGGQLHSFGYRLFQKLKPEYQLQFGVVYIDFPPQDDFFPRFGFSEVYRRVINKDLFFLKQNFKDKIVIVGNVNSLSHDRYLTPLRYLNDGHERMHGPDIHASVIQTLYADRFLKKFSAYAIFPFYFALAALTGLLTVHLPFRRLIFSLISLIALLLLVSVFCFLQLRVLPLASGLSVIALSLMMVSVYRYMVLDSEKRRVHRLFEMFLTSQVVQGVLELEDSKLREGKKMRLCILFSDIRGFTTFSKETDELEVVRRLNEYFGLMSEVVSGHGGVVSRFFGDGMLAFFGAFDDTENPSLSGAKASLNMLQKLRDLNNKWRWQNKEPFKIGIGLHTGEVALGGIGSDKRMEFTLTGDAANLASRVESKTKELGETILISKEVYDDIHDKMPNAVAFEDKGVQPIKGRTPKRLYALKWNERPAS